MNPTAAVMSDHPATRAAARARGPGVPCRVTGVSRWEGWVRGRYESGLPAVEARPRTAQKERLDICRARLKIQHTYLDSLSLSGGSHARVAFLHSRPRRIHGRRARE